MAIFRVPFSSTTASQFIVPLGVTKVQVKLWGAGGGGGGGSGNTTNPKGGNGGGGGYTFGVIPVTPGDVLDIQVGGKGGGGQNVGTPISISNGAGGGGGGYTVISRDGVTLAVAAGGGGGGGSDQTVSSQNLANAGAGGGSTGQDGEDGPQSGTTGGGGGKGATQTAGGAGGTSLGGSFNGEAGSALLGGRGAVAFTASTWGGGGIAGINGGAEGGDAPQGRAAGGGGGGGGGWFGGGGGGGGAAVPATGGMGGGGAGGASYTASIVEDPLTTQGKKNLVANSIDPDYQAAVGNGGAGGNGTVAGADGQDGYLVIIYTMSTGMVSTVTIGSTLHSVYSLTNDPVTDADLYLQGRAGSDSWTAATADQKKAAIVSAARWMDRVTTFSGTQLNDYQSRAWPRSDATCNGNPVPEGDIPLAVVSAEFELAFILIGDATAQDASGQGSNVKRAKAGSAEVEFFGATIGSSRDTRLPTIAHDMLKCLSGNTGGLLGGNAYGVDTPSAFDDTDFTRSEGLY